MPNYLNQEHSQDHQEALVQAIIVSLGLLTEALSSMFPEEAVYRGLSEAKQDSYSFFVCNDSGTEAETSVLVY